MRTRFLIVQHAEKVAEPGDPGLTPRGVAQAHAVALRLAQVDVTAVYSSQLRRARQTAELIARFLGLGVTVDDRLRERMNWTGDEPLEAFLAEWSRSTGDRDYQPRVGESSRAAGERLERALGDLAARHPDQNVVVIGHGGVTVDVARNLLGDEGVEALAAGVIEGGIPNAAITEVVWGPGGARPRRLADTFWAPVR